MQPNPEKFNTVLRCSDELLCNDYITTPQKYKSDKTQQDKAEYIYKQWGDNIRE